MLPEDTKTTTDKDTTVTETEVTETEVTETEVNEPADETGSAAPDADEED